MGIEARGAGAPLRLPPSLTGISGIASLPRRFMDLNASIPRPVNFYRLGSRYHLGDRWARLNLALRRIEGGEEIALYLPDDGAREILSSLDIGHIQPNLLAEKPAIDAESRKIIRQISTGETAYRCRSLPAKMRHTPAGRLVGVSLAANWRPSEKIPTGIENTISSLRSLLPSHEFVSVGKPHQNSVTELVAALARLQLLLSVDNGVAHVARSVGVPLFLLEHLLPISRGFPREACDYTLVKSHTVIDSVLEWVELNSARSPRRNA